MRPPKIDFMILILQLEKHIINFIREKNTFFNAYLLDK